MALHASPLAHPDRLEAANHMANGLDLLQLGHSGPCRKGHGVEGSVHLSVLLPVKTLRSDQALWLNLEVRTLPQLTHHLLLREVCKATQFTLEGPLTTLLRLQVANLHLSERFVDLLPFGHRTGHKLDLSVSPAAKLAALHFNTHVPQHLLCFDTISMYVQGWHALPATLTRQGVTSLRRQGRESISHRGPLCLGTGIVSGPRPVFHQLKAFCVQLSAFGLIH